MVIALTRAVSPAIARCELSHVEREPIDPGLATRQHREYEAALRSLGVDVRTLPPEPALPDSVFIEDIAVVFDDFAIVTRPGAASRRPEVPAVAAALAAFRPLHVMEAPATLDGGDVLRIGATVYVGESERTNEEGRAVLRSILEPLGYAVRAAPVRGCLHLKTAVTEVADGTVLMNPAWTDADRFADYRIITVDPAEPFAGNALRIGDAVLYPAEHGRTAERLRKEGLRIVAVPVGELARAEGGVTCCSLIVPFTSASRGARFHPERSTAEAS